MAAKPIHGQRGVFLTLALISLLLLGTAASRADDAPPKAGPDFPVNSTTSGSQFFPDVARFVDGGFVVVWYDNGSPKARRFAADGAALGGEIALGPSGSVLYPPRVAALPDGGFAAVWADARQVTLRRFDRQAQPVGEPILFNGPGIERHVSPDIAAGPSGELALVWILRRDTDAVRLLRFDRQGSPPGEPFTVSQGGGLRFSPRVAMNAAGSLLVSWESSLAPGIMVRRFDGPTGAWSAQARLHGFGFNALDVAQLGSEPVLYPEGDGALAFVTRRTADFEGVVQRLDAQGQPAGALISLDLIEPSAPPQLAIDADGGALAVWGGYEKNSGPPRIFGRLFDRSWNAVGDRFPVSPDTGLHHYEPVVASSASGGFVVVWADGDLDPPSHVVPFPPRSGRDGSLEGVFGQAFRPRLCGGGSVVLCLGPGDRFRVQAFWKTPGGQTGAGLSRKLTSDTGALWFFDPSNLEVILKVLDGRAVNGSFWVFYGALSNVEYDITVFDSATGELSTYHNPAGQLASRADVNAFRGLSPPPASSVAVASASSLLVPESAASGCDADGEGLCLMEGRFRVEVEFTDPRTGAAGQGRVVPLTADTGGVWFFAPDNLELMIKVLDGRALNGRFWVFFGALSDVAYRITVTDLETGERKAYDNTRGRLASRADVDAFR